MRKRIVWIFVVVVVLGLLFIVGRINGFVYGGFFGGSVVYEETQEPVEGAFVIALWESRTFHQSHCVHMDIQRTDEDGNFFFPVWADFVRHTVFSDYLSEIMIYIPGYEKVNYSSPYYVRKSGKTEKERIKDINRISWLFCGDGQTDLKAKIGRVRKKMYEEANELLGDIKDDPEGRYAYDVIVLKRMCGSPCQ